MSHRPDPVEALHADLLVSEIGISGAARLIGRSAQVLYNKFSESMPGNELTGREERALAEAVNSLRYIQACCACHGGIFVKLPEGRAADDDLLEDYMAIMARMGELSTDLTKAREDGVIDGSDFDRLRYDGQMGMAAIQTFIEDLSTMVREVPRSTPPRPSGRRNKGDR